MKRQYKIEDYRKNYMLFSGNKGSEELAIVAIIMNLLNNNKFDNIDDALKYNGNDFATFMKNNRRDNIPFHYGRNIKDDDFKLIVSNFKKMDEDKLKIDKENIHEHNFENKEYVEYDGRVMDNSLKERSIEDELKNMQQENPEYQSFDAKENTQKMMKEELDYNKREVNFNSLDEIDRNKLNADEQKLYDAVLIDEHTSGKNKEVSFEDMLTKDENNNINQLENNGNSISINGVVEDNGIEETSISLLSSIDTDLLTAKEKELYAAAKKYQEVTGELIRLDLSNNVIITPFNEVKDIITKDGVLVVNDDRIINSDSLTTEEEMEQEMENIKVKKLEFPKPFSNYNLDDLAA